MEPTLHQEEKELVKLIGFFKKRAEILIIENRLGEEYKQMLETCDKLVEQLYLHAKSRQTVLSEREQLRGMIKDNAVCPKCNSNEQLKVIGTEANDKGWKSNKYKCRKCNISFVWNTPNNPWDMIPYVEQYVDELEVKLNDTPDEDARAQNLAAVQQMRESINKLKPVVAASDLDLAEMEERERQMQDMVHKFKKHLMIEKIRMED